MICSGPDECLNAPDTCWTMVECEERRGSNLNSPLRDAAIEAMPCPDARARIRAVQEARGKETPR